MGGSNQNLDFSLSSQNPYQNMSTVRVRPQKSLGPQRLLTNQKSNFASYSNIGLYPCKGCSKTFTLEQLPIHMKRCKEQPLEQTPQQTQSMGKRPRFVVCDICHKQFGKASLEIHKKTCKWKHANEQFLLGPEERAKGGAQIPKR